MKLMQAINKMNTATIENSRTYTMRPPSCLPFLNGPYKYRLEKGTRNNDTLESSFFPFTKSLIFAVTASESLPSCNVRYVGGPLLSQFVTHVFSILNSSNDRTKSNCCEEFGTLSNTPLT